MAIKDSTAGRWFRRVLWVGIVSNIALSIPILIAPERVLAASSLPPASPVLWPRFSGLLLILLSAFYMPAGIDPDRYLVTAWLAIMSRLVGVIFFVGTQPAEYRMLGYFDLAFFIPEAILLTMAVTARGGTGAARSGGGNA